MDPLPDDDDDDDKVLKDTIVAIRLEGCLL